MFLRHPPGVNPLSSLLQAQPWHKREVLHYHMGVCLCACVVASEGPKASYLFHATDKSANVLIVLVASKAYCTPRGVLSMCPWPGCH